MFANKAVKCFFAVFFILAVLFTSVSCKTVYNLAVSSNPANGGTVTPGSGAYENGVTVTLTAQPAAGYRFNYWSGNATGTQNPTSFVMDGIKDVTANFIAQYTLNVTINSSDGGTVTPVNGIYDEGVQVELTATAAPGYRFLNWSGDATGAYTNITVVMNGNKNITANFIAQYTLNISVSPVAGGKVTKASGTYDDGATFTITAIPNDGFAFDQWSGDGAGTSTSIDVTVNGDLNIVANFVHILAISVGQDAFYPYIHILFPDDVGGNSVIFYLWDWLQEYINSFRIQSSGVDDVTGDLLWHREILVYSFQRVATATGYKVVGYDWQVTIWNDLTGEMWHHVGRFENIICNQSITEILSFIATIDGHVYSYY